MLWFFRRYQRVIFLFTTAVIVVSFSFFGSYSASNNTTYEDPIAFTAVDGTRIYRSELEAMAMFLSTDMVDRFSSAYGHGANFLNDGVVRNDILAAGLAPTIAEPFLPALSEELKTRSQKEKRFQPYSHPQARFITAESAWTFFAPELKEGYDKVRQATNAATTEAFSDRIALYLAEGEFPPYQLSQVLRYQEQQYEWVQSDSRLPYSDLSLFHYHSVDDWFGKKFMRLTAQFIINTAKVAEQREFVVTKEEALADLIRHAQISYRYDRDNPDVPMTGAGAYMDDHLRKMGMDRNRAVKVWRQVLLFRRLMAEAGESVLVDGLAYEQLAAFSNEAVTVEQYLLPQEFRFASPDQLYRFEEYLDAVAIRDEAEPLALPTRFKSVGKVKNSFPELVQRRYLLAITSVDKARLQARVGVKRTWQWEVEPANWTVLQKAFPDIGAANAETEQERFAVLDNLDIATRNRIDAFARNAIVDLHPEWIDSALEEQQPQLQGLSLRYGGKNFPFEGVTDREGLIALLDEAPTADAAHIEHVEPSELLRAFSANGQHYYRILVVDRGDGIDEIVTFGEAVEGGALDVLVDTDLGRYYRSNREKNASLYRRADGTWKPLTDVKQQVGAERYRIIYQRIYNDYLTNGGKLAPTEPTGEFVAAHRFDMAMRLLRNSVVASPAAAETLLVHPDEPLLRGHLPVRDGLAGQWRLVKEERVVERNEYDGDLFHPDAGLGHVLTLEEGEWSPVLFATDGGVSFVKVSHKGLSDETAITKKMDAARELLGREAKRALTSSLFDTFLQAEAMQLPEEKTQPEEEI